MQSIAVTLRSLRLYSATTRTSLLPLVRASSTSATTINTTNCEAAGAGDPAVHSGEPPEDSYPDKPAKFSGAEAHQQKDQNAPPSPSTPPLPTTKDAKENASPFSPSQKLESHEVIPPDAASFQQKRRRLSHVAALDDVSCVGADGSSLTRVGASVEEVDDDVEEYRRYYEDHKPSPLSEIEMADTRKPITRSTDGSASDRAMAGEEGMGVMAEETMDDALARAESMFREKAQRGDPEWPHSRALARMLEERDREEGGLHVVGL
ncbi:uncharacterized protein [Typha latifolia]|uniref:uncharacterized protein n=1 Tax=Typha latifolia TaxID=4733 RepID=UPI003C2B9EF0